MRDDNEGAGPLTMLGMLIAAPFTIYAEHRRNWSALDEIERNLRRASHGFALLVTLGAAFFFFGPASVGHWLAELVTDPGQAWRGALFLALIAYGLVRFLIGTRGVRGVRDGPRAANGFVKLALGLAVAVYLWRASWPWQQFGGALWGWGALALHAVFVVASLYALTGAVRFFLMTGYASSALRAVRRQIRRDQTVMRPAGSRPWWNFWGR